MPYKKPSYEDLENELFLLKKENKMLKLAFNSDKVNSDKLNTIKEYEHMVLRLKENEQKLKESNEEYLATNEELKSLNELLETARKQIEKSEERLQLIIKNSNDIFVLVNENGEQFFISDVVEKLTGFNAEELSGPIEHVIYPDDLDIVKNHWARMMADKTKADRIEYRHKHKEKGYIWLEAIAQNFLDNPAINSVVANIRDITERKEIEEALKKITAANERLQEKERDRMLSKIAENKKKLASAALKSVQSAERDDEMLKQLEEIKQNTNRKGIEIIKTLITNYKRTSLNMNWQEFETVFEDIHHDFYVNLNKKFPNLTTNEIKICAFLKLNLSSKDIAQITFQSEEALKKARYRLRKKLGIKRETNMVTFLNSI